MFTLDEEVDSDTLDTRDEESNDDDIQKEIEHFILGLIERIFFIPNVSPDDKG